MAAPGVRDLPVTLRDCGPGDDDFLLAVYGSTRADELALVPWPAEHKAAFVRQQFGAQDTHYRAAYPDCRRSVVLVDGAPAGRLYVQRSAEEILVVDISLLPPFRGRGVGTALLAELTAEAAGRRVPVVLHVAVGNDRAARLYRRLGFAPRGSSDTHLRMEWVG